MTTREIKTDISRIIDAMPDEIIMELYEDLKVLESFPDHAKQKAFKFLSILKEDKELLERLAK